MAAKRGTKGDYICHVPKGGHRKGCGAGNTVRELDKYVKRLEKKMDKRLDRLDADVAESTSRAEKFEMNFKALKKSGAAAAKKRK